MGMTNITTAKKSSLQDWHWKDVLVALHKAGWSLRQLGMANGYDDGNALGEAARRPFPKAERIISQAIGVAPNTIWPSRYGTDGQPNRRRGPAPRRPAGFGVKSTAHTHGRNLQSARG